MSIKLVEGAVAAGFGAADALVAAKVKGTGPGGIPWAVLLEGAGIAIGLVGEKVGIQSEVRDPILFASLTLAGARLSRAASSGNLMSGPKAWGGVAADTYRPAMGAGGGGGAAFRDGSTANLRLLPGRTAGMGPFTTSPTLFEAAGVTG